MAARTSHTPRPGGALALAAALATMLGGCTLAPRYDRPPAPVAAAYPDPPPGFAEPLARDTRAATDIGWREFFRDPRLQALIAAALDNNRDLRIATLRIEEAHALYQVQRADLLPQLDATAGATRQRLSAAQPPGGQRGIRQTYQAGGGVAAYELDLFGRVRSLSNAALAQYAATEEARRAAQLSLVAEVATGYLAERSYAEQADIARATLDARERALALSQRRFGSGTASALEVQDNASLVAQARVASAELARQRAQAQNALEVLTGTPLGAIVGLPDALALSDQGVTTDLPAGLPSALLAQRPDIRQAEQELLSANAIIGAARAAFFPRITLTATAGSISPTLASLFEAGTGTWLFSPQLVLPVFNVGRNRAGLDLAQTRKQIQVAAYERAVQAAFRDVADALAARATLQEQVAAQMAVRDAEAARVRLAGQRWCSGVTGQLESLDAQRQLLAAEQALVQARERRLVNAVALYRALGGGLREYRGTAAPLG
ncbi:multidrug transporter [Cupriavidus sp. SK-4]|uniref:efflux transporter outer membrane subunit n=1 Tax=Cupriavidus sp. SK-4 TaxID=574750 RepID=UPI00044EA604|nr:efflux transporter outer membrane subunit [Cupriavidus sp. SK-4]EYS85876.1 multidrug transporter [Cupriavidus sp. SK-4]